jgi:GNAT superfamily N-acetyltransferase
LWRHVRPVGGGTWIIHSKERSLNPYWPPGALVEIAEVAAFEDLYAAASWDFIHETGLWSARSGEAVALCLPASDAKVYNRVVGLGVAEPATPEMIDGALDWFRNAGVYNPAFTVTPDAQPPELAGWLYERGLRPIDALLKFYRDNAPVSPVRTDLNIMAIGPEQAWHFVQVLAEGFGSPEWLGYWLARLVGRPEWHIYVAYDGMTPAACGALFARNGVGWLGFGATRPAYRRRGAQGAIMAKRLQDGRDMGCQVFTTETWEPEPGESNASLNNMVRSGFHFVHRRLNFAYPD